MSYAPRILALDLASRTGWAVGEPSDARPASGSLRFATPGASLGAIYAACRQWLSDFVAADPEIRLIVFEAPMAPQYMAGFATAHIIRILIGLCAVVEEFAYAPGPVHLSACAHCKAMPPALAAFDMERDDPRNRVAADNFK